MLLWASLVVLVGGVYASTLDAPFVFDDLSNILNNVHVRLTALSVDGLFKAAFYSPVMNRPVANVSFALNYYLHGYQVWGYHAVNVLIHLSTGLLLALFVYTTLHTPALRAHYPIPAWTAGVTALLWLVHPLHPDSVSYVTQRMNSLTAMFYLAALVLYVQARLTPHRWTQWWLLASCGLSGLLALGTKEIAALLPVVLGLYEWYFFQDLCWHWLKRRGFPMLGGLVVCGLGLVWVYTLGHPLTRLSNISQGYLGHVTLGERLLTEFRVVCFYVRLLLFPHPSQLTLEHDFTVSRALLDPPTTLLAIVALVGLVVLACSLAPKHRLMSFCLGWFILHLVIECLVIEPDLVYEYRTYLPSMLLILLVVTLVSRAVSLVWLQVAILSLIILVWSVWTYDRNRVWTNEETLWQDCVAKAPNNARSHTNLGNVLAQKGKFEEAKAHYSEALRLYPVFAKTTYHRDFIETIHYNLGLILTQEEKFEEAKAHYAEALRLRPMFAEAHTNLGNLLIQEGKLEEAKAHYAEALRLPSAFAETIHYNLGSVLTQEGKLEEAKAHYAEALRLRPTFAEVYYSLGLLFIQQGKWDKAIAALQVALYYRPHWPQVANKLAELLETQARPHPTEFD